MKNILFTIKLLFTSGLLIASNNSEAFFEDSKVISKSFKASSETELEIVNKHGNVTFETWEKDSVSVQVIIKATSDKLDQIQSLLSAVDIRFLTSTDFISVNSIWNTSTGFRMDVTKLLGGQKINVNYLVKLPKNIEVNISNKFGDVSFDDFDGKMKVDVSHGRFSARNINNLKKLEAQYTKVDIKSCKDADFILKFSNLRLKEARKVAIDAVSSDVKIDKLLFITIKITNGNLTIASVSDVQISSSMSSIEIEKLAKNFNGTIKFGSVLIESISNDFESISIDGFSIDIRLDFNNQVYFTYSVELEGGKSFKIPTTGNKLENETTLGNAKKYEGVFSSGNATVTSSKVVMKAKSSYLTIGTYN